MGSRVATAIGILAVGSGTGCGAATDGLPGDFCGFLARLLEEAVVAPQVGSVLGTAYEDATGPGCADSCSVMSGPEWGCHVREGAQTSGVRVVLELRLGELICGAVVWGG